MAKALSFKCPTKYKSTNAKTDSITISNIIGIANRKTDFLIGNAVKSKFSLEKDCLINEKIDPILAVKDFSTVIFLVLKKLKILDKFLNQNEFNVKLPRSCKYSFQLKSERILPKNKSFFSIPIYLFDFIIFTKTAILRRNEKNCFYFI